MPNAEHFHDGLVRTTAPPPLESHAIERDGSTLAIRRDFPPHDHRPVSQRRPAKDGKGFVPATLALKRTV